MSEQKLEDSVVATCIAPDNLPTISKSEDGHNYSKRQYEMIEVEDKMEENSTEIEDSSNEIKDNSKTSVKKDGYTKCTLNDTVKISLAESITPDLICIHINKVIHMKKKLLLNADIMEMKMKNMKNLANKEAMSMNENTVELQGRSDISNNKKKPVENELDVCGESSTHEKTSIKKGGCTKFFWDDSMQRSLIESITNDLIRKYVQEKYRKKQLLLNAGAVKNTEKLVNKDVMLMSKNSMEFQETSDWSKNKDKPVRNELDNCERTCTHENLKKKPVKMEDSSTLSLDSIKRSVVESITPDLIRWRIKREKYRNKKLLLNADTMEMKMKNTKEVSDVDAIQMNKKTLELQGASGKCNDYLYNKSKDQFLKKSNVQFAKKSKGKGTKIMVNKSSIYSVDNGAVELAKKSKGKGVKILRNKSSKCLVYNAVKLAKELKGKGSKVIMNKVCTCSVGNGAAGSRNKGIHVTDLWSTEKKFKVYFNTLYEKSLLTFDKPYYVDPVGIKILGPIITKRAKFVAKERSKLLTKTSYKILSHAVFSNLSEVLQSGYNFSRMCNRRKFTTKDFEHGIKTHGYDKILKDTSAQFTGEPEKIVSLLDFFPKK